MAKLIQGGLQGPTAKQALQTNVAQFGQGMEALASFGNELQRRREQRQKDYLDTVIVPEIERWGSPTLAAAKNAEIFREWARMGGAGKKRQEQFVQDVGAGDWSALDMDANARALAANREARMGGISPLTPEEQSVMLGEQYRLSQPVQAAGTPSSVPGMEQYDRATGGMDAHHPAVLGDGEGVINAVAMQNGGAEIVAQLNKQFPNPAAQLAPDSVPTQIGREVQNAGVPTMAEGKEASSPASAPDPVKEEEKRIASIIKFQDMAQKTEDPQVQQMIMQNLTQLGWQPPPPPPMQGQLSPQLASGRMPVMADGVAPAYAATGAVAPPAPPVLSEGERIANIQQILAIKAAQQNQGNLSIIPMLDEKLLELGYQPPPQQDPRLPFGVQAPSDPTGMSDLSWMTPEERFQMTQEMDRFRTPVQAGGRMPVMAPGDLTDPYALRSMPTDTAGLMGAPRGGVASQAYYQNVGGGAGLEQARARTGFESAEREIFQRMQRTHGGAGMSPEVAKGIVANLDVGGSGRTMRREIDNFVADGIPITEDVIAQLGRKYKIDPDLVSTTLGRAPDIAQGIISSNLSRAGMPSRQAMSRGSTLLRELKDVAGRAVRNPTVRKAAAGLGTAAATGARVLGAVSPIDDFLQDPVSLGGLGTSPEDFDARQRMQVAQAEQQRVQGTRPETGPFSWELGGKPLLPWKEGGFHANPVPYNAGGRMPVMADPGVYIPGQGMVPIPSVNPQTYTAEQMQGYLTGPNGDLILGPDGQPILKSSVSDQAGSIGAGGPIFTGEGGLNVGAVPAQPGSDMSPEEAAAVKGAAVGTYLDAQGAGFSGFTTPGEGALGARSDVNQPFADQPEGSRTVKESDYVDSFGSYVNSFTKNGVKYVNYMPREGATEEEAPDVKVTPDPIYTDTTNEVPESTDKRTKGQDSIRAGEAERWFVRNRPDQLGRNRSDSTESFLNTYYPEGMSREELLLSPKDSADFKLRDKALEESIRQFDKNMSIEERKQDFDEWVYANSSERGKMSDREMLAYDNANELVIHLRDIQSDLAADMGKAISHPDVQAAYGKHLVDNDLVNQLNQASAVIASLTGNEMFTAWGEVAAKDPKWYNTILWGIGRVFDRENTRMQQEEDWARRQSAKGNVTAEPTTVFTRDLFGDAQGEVDSVVSAAERNRR